MSSSVCQSVSRSRPVVVSHRRTLRFSQVASVRPSAEKANTCVLLDEFRTSRVSWRPSAPVFQSQSRVKVFRNGLSTVTSPVKIGGNNQWDWNNNMQQDVEVVYPYAVSDTNVIVIATANLQNKKTMEKRELNVAGNANTK